MAESSTNGRDQQEEKDRGAAPAETVTKESHSVAAHLTYTSSGSSDPEEAPEAADEVLTRGTAVGRYLVLDRLGAGAMGVVYAAYDPKLDRKIALKLLRWRKRGGDHAHRTARLEREAQAIAKLSHPNVVGIFDVGVHQGQLFLAMEYLSGGTMRDWLAVEKRPWRRIVEMFIEVGKGLSAAHAEGLIHRDFKPDNVLIDKNGIPKVVDFGLVRLEAALEDSPGGPDDPDPLDDGDPNGGSLAMREPRTPLTQSGALAGTPAYMASEQLLAKTIDARSDQFAFCVGLYEALYGERPFAGETLMALVASVVTGRVRDPAKDSEVPAWLRRVITIGLASDPAQRWASMDPLIAALRNDPAVRVRRRATAAGAVAVAIIAALAIRHVVVQRRDAIDRRVAEHLKAADVSLGEAARQRSAAKDRGDRALSTFDNFQRDQGEELWAACLTLRKEASAAYQAGIQRLEAAAGLLPHQAILDRTGDALAAYATLEGRTREERAATVRQLSAYDLDGRRRRQLEAAATVRIATATPGTSARIETYDPVTFRPSGAARELGRTPLDLSLPAGSYRLTFAETNDRVGFYYPVVLAAGERQDISLMAPRRSMIPDGFVYVPEGRFLFGSADEDSRAVFLETTPLHAVTTPAFLISKYETTIGEWIAFLDALPARDREQRRPHGKKDLVAGFLDIHQNPAGSWEILFRATETLYRARQGEPFRYTERDRRATQDWLRFPVAGVSPGDVLAYAAWLNHSGRVPGARLCSEREWERANRGADARAFPHGNRLLHDDANFDLTYGRKSGGYGPDEVGSHPASVSPFGVQDMVGNVWEIASSVLDKDQFVARGGSFYQNLRSMLSSNRDPISAVTRDHTVGFRICATPRF